MSALVAGLVWEQQITETFGRPEKYILLAYADHADQNGNNIFPSVELIARKTGYEERSVQMITRTLETLGYLVARGMGQHGTNRWSIPITRTEGGAKIAPLPLQKFAPEGIAPEGIAPEGIAPEPSVVVINVRFGEVARKLSELTGALNTKSADVIDTWLEKHTNEWIFKAIEMAQAKGARNASYVDTILIGWEANGYPPTRDEKVKGAKYANNRTGNPKRTDETPAEYSDDDRAAAEHAKKLKAERRVAVS